MMNWVYFLSLISALLMAASADDTACCFSDTFMMSGQIRAHSSYPGPFERNITSDVNGHLSIKGDFLNERFRINWSASTKTAGGPMDDTRDIVMRIIVDASGDTPLVYWYEKGLDRDPTVTHCRYAALDQTQNIRGFQCAPKSVLRAGNVLGNKLRAYLEALPSHVNNAFKLYLDPATCVPVKVSVNKLPISRGTLEFHFDGTADDGSALGDQDFQFPSDMKTRCRHFPGFNFPSMEDFERYIEMMKHSPMWRQ